MIEPATDSRRPPITPQLALRVAVLGGFAFVLFAVVFFRLWYLQVLSGDQYLQQARDNRVREVRVQAPRGAIVDSSGRKLVENRTATVVTLDPEKLPAAERSAAARWGQLAGQRSLRPKGKQGPPVAIPPPQSPELARLIDRLARTLGMSPKTIQQRIVNSLALVPYANVTVKVDVDDPTRNYLSERSELFPGVSVQSKYLRKYPQGALAAQLVGTIGEIDPKELDDDRFKGVPQGTVIGKGGIERSYDQYLRGTDGSTKITIDALGRPKGSAQGRDVVPGRQLQTSLNFGLQQTGQKYLAQAIGQTPGFAGAFVAMDPRDGRVLAMGSAPTFDPAVLSRPISPATFKRLYGATQSGQGGAPVFNRAIGGAYPTGSIFKPITALAGLATGLIHPQDVIQDNGCITIGREKREVCNAKKQALGPVNLRSAISKSSDVYFYKLGLRLNALAGQPLQKWARRLGLDHTTGIDVPGEFGGLVPDRAWRNGLAEQERRCRAKKHISLLASPQTAGAKGCGISDMRPWSEGDEVNLATGQGDLQATPLQMATVYAALENKGRVVRPHLGVAVEDANGRLLQRIETGTSRKIAFDPADRDAVLKGLHGVTTDGTAAEVFKGWPQNKYPVFGKTGTAVRNNQPNDQSWFAAFVPDAKRPIVVVATVENGGFGAVAAAPVVKAMLAKYYRLPIKYTPGSSSTF